MATSSAAATSPLDAVKHIVLVLSGKGGVGKSTVTVELAVTLAEQGRKVGILDIDLCGPSIGLMLNAKEQTVMCRQDGWEPVYSATYPNISLMSIAFLLKSG
jgi:Mrp family chromosome partitioning ATPase